SVCLLRHKKSFCRESRLRLCPPFGVQGPFASGPYTQFTVTAFFTSSWVFVSCTLIGRPPTAPAHSLVIVSNAATLLVWSQVPSATTNEIVVGPSPFASITLAPCSV